MSKKLERKSGKLLGVYAGIGDYMELDPTIVRLGFVLLFFFAGGGILLYLILALIMPKAY
jgi:phage shock protein C